MALSGQLIQYYNEKLNVKEIINSVDPQSFDEALNICDLTKVVEKYQLWQKHLPQIVPYYAVKCNDDIQILRVLADLKVNFDCASKNEITKVLDLGVSPDRIIFANPCKPKSHVTFAKETGVKRATIDCEFEIYKIYNYFPEMELVVRFKCDAKEAQCPLGDKFGCTAENEAIALMLLAKGLELKVIGVSFHVGSGCHDYKAFERALKTAKHLFDFGINLGFEMRLLDIGGGFPGDDDSGFEAISKIINRAIEKYFEGEDLDIIAEPGRFFAASAYTLVCKIHAKREIRNENKLDTVMYYLNDGIYGMFNCILFDHQTVTVNHILDTSNETPKVKSLIWGPTCDALDKISENLLLPNLNSGDYLLFPNMGAYSLPIASTFNGFMRPKTIYFQKLE